MSEIPLPWTERLCCVSSTSTYWYLGKALSHGKVAQWKHGHSKGGTDRPRRDFTWVPEAGRGATSDWRHIQGCKSLASRVQCVCARAVQNWCSSLLLGLLFSRFYTDHPVPHFSLFTHFKNIDATTLFYFQSSVDQIYTLYPSFTQEDFLSLKMAYLYHWPLVSTVIFSDFSFFIFWQQGGAGVVSCYCQPVLISVNKRNVSQPLFEVSGCCSFEKCEH